MMCLISKNMKKVELTTRFKHSLYSFDKSDPKNLKLPEFIENLSEDNLFELMPKLVLKYEQENYSNLNREELEDINKWNDLDVLILIKFYKNNWSFSIVNEEEFFPDFVFTYNIQPLKIQCDKIISYCYDKIEQDLKKNDLKNSYKFNALDITHLLHYFVITNKNEKSEK